MKRIELRAYCLSKRGAREDFPFGADVAVYKVMGKMFALIPVDVPNQISLKCDPTFAEVLRQTYAEVTPGWHLNKQHWNSIITDGSIPDDEIQEMIDHSYELVVKGLTKKDRERLDRERK
jgi:predicted DNA-binding protein (MmcQ/YjbR family)